MHIMYFLKFNNHSIIIKLYNIFIKIFFGFLILVQPIDLIKTLYQMQMNEEFLQTSFLDTARIIYKTHGVTGLYIGWQARLIQYIIQTFFTSALLEYLEHRVVKLQDQLVFKQARSCIFVAFFLFNKFRKMIILSINS